MSTASAYLTVAGIDVDVIYKDIKNLHIGVYPPFGRVRVSAPSQLDDEQVRLALVQRLPWIKRQGAQLQKAARQSEREMVTGRVAFRMGKAASPQGERTARRAHVEIDGDRLLLYVPERTEVDKRRQLLDHWYREQLRNALPSIIEACEARAHVEVTRWSIRRMKTKWGSCNRETGHIWFNVELAKKHPDCLEYIAIHGMAHLRVRNHGDAFVNIMYEILPDWRARRDLLNGSPLAHEEWRQ